MDSTYNPPAYCWLEFFPGINTPVQDPDGVTREEDLVAPNASEIRKASFLLNSHVFYISIV